MAVVPARPAVCGPYVPGVKRIPAQERHQVGRVLLGRRVAALRADAGLTVRALAARTGISVGYVGGIETGRRLPGLDVLDLLAQALGTDAARMVDGVYPWGAPAAPPD